MKNLFKKYIFALVLSLCLLTYNSIPACCSPIETNNIPNWPAGPELDAEAAFLFEANTGVVLYAKNIHEHLYPASTTKLMTALLAAENSQMDEIVEFSYDSVFSLEPGSSNMGIDPGQALPMSECLYGIMVASANEVANAVAEHVAGDMDSFVKMMNDRAKALGLKDTHFTNANGLMDEKHYTSAYDLGMIAREAFNNENLTRVVNTSNHHFEPTDRQPDDFYVRNKHKLINGEIPYPGVKGGKTGFTSESRETLVTCAENNGMRLICVILKEESPEQFNDTVKLFDYGFSNFAVANVSENETGYAIQSTNFFPTTVDILGNSDQILELNPDKYIILPKNISFSDLTTKVTYETNDESDVAYIEYSYNGAYLGNGSVRFSDKKPITSAFDSNLTEYVDEKPIEKKEPVFINILYICTYVVLGIIILSIISLVHSYLINYNLLDNMKDRRRTRRRRIRKDRGGLKF